MLRALSTSYTYLHCQKMYSGKSKNRRRDNEVMRSCIHVAKRFCDFDPLRSWDHENRQSLLDKNRIHKKSIYYLKIVLFSKTPVCVRAAGQSVRNQVVKFHRIFLGIRSVAIFSSGWLSLSAKCIFLGPYQTWNCFSTCAVVSMHFLLSKTVGLAHTWTYTIC